MKSQIEILNMLDDVVDEIMKGDYTLPEKVTGDDVIEMLLLVRKWIAE